MPNVTITIPEDMVSELEPYREELGDLIRIGLREVKIEQALALFKRGGISLWRAARMAGVSRREMAQHAAAHGLRAEADEATIAEELA